jgi:hypothetical protein
MPRPGAGGPPGNTRSERSGRDGRAEVAKRPRIATGPGAWWLASVPVQLLMRRAHATPRRLEVGVELPPLTRAPDRAQLSKFAACGGDFNALHSDPDFAQARAIGDNIRPSVQVRGAGAAANRTWLAHDGFVRRTLAFYRGIGSPRRRLHVLRTDRRPQRARRLADRRTGPLDRERRGRALHGGRGRGDPRALIERSGRRLRGEAAESPARRKTQLSAWMGRTVRPNVALVISAMAVYAPAAAVSRPR